MISEEEYIRRVMWKTTRDLIQNLLRTKEYSALFLSRTDVEIIDKTIEHMSIDVVDELIKALKSRGYLGTGKTASSREFQALFESIIRKYLEKHDTHSNIVR